MIDPSQWQSFAEYEAYAGSLPTEKARGDAFEGFVWAYLLLTPELGLTSAWRLRETPAYARQRLGLSPHDIGVDFVAARRDEELWTVQAKYRRANTSVSWRELSTFVGASGKADFRLLVTNGVELPRNRPTNLNELGFGAVLRAQLADLDRSFFCRWSALLKERRPSPPKRLQPRQDQLAAVEAVTSGFASGASRLQLIAACGTGKTLTSLWIVERLEGVTRVLFLCPSLALVHQTLKSWSEQFRLQDGLDSLVVCSDQTVGDIRPYELPVPVARDAARVHEFWERQGGLRVVFATYQSLELLRSGLSGAAPVDLLIADEAHRVAGREGKAFQGVLHDHVLNARRRLFMTATPRIVHRRGVRPTQDNDDGVTSMDDPARFGTVAYTLSFGRAIELGLLTDYQIDVIAVTNDEVREYIDRRLLVDAEQHAVDAETLGQAVALERAQTRDSLFRYAFTYHHRVESARAFAQTLTLLIGPSTGRQQFFVDAVDGEMSVARRKTILSEMLESQSGIVCSARALAEGVDTPSVDAVVFVAPKTSVVDIVQAAGRALRLDHNRPDKRAHIVIPVFIGSTEFGPEELEGSAWESVWHVVQAMRAHDEVLAATIDAQMTELGRRRARGESTRGIDSHLGGRLVLTLPQRLSLDDFRDAIALKAIEMSGESFWSAFGRLEVVANERGHARIPRDLVHHGFPIGRWASKRRLEYRRNRLAADRVAALASLAGWTWDPFADDFEVGLTVLLRYAEREGHCNVKVDHVEDGFRLGVWVLVRRKEHASQRLSPERTAQLEAVKGWSWRRRHETSREIGLRALRTFADREGHTRVPGDHVEGRHGLGTWVEKQRSGYRHERLKPSEIAELEAMPGWSWTPFDDAFEERYRALREFIAHNGHARVPRSRSSASIQLATWVSNLRAQYARKELSADRVALLEALPGWTWDPHDDDFNAGCRALSAFAEREGHTWVPRAHVEGELRLGLWTKNLRGRYSRAELPRERIRTVEAIPHWQWDPFADSFVTALSALRSFMVREGNCRVPIRHVEAGVRLGQWAKNLKIPHQQRKLTAAQREAVEALPGWRWTKK